MTKSVEPSISLKNRDLTMQQRMALAVWAADCAERVLDVFERAMPDDSRPRDAVVATRAWVRGEVNLTTVRPVAVACHAAAREAKAAGFDAACFSARAAGHAAGTVHSSQHCKGAAAYALKAVEDQVAESIWQRDRLTVDLKRRVYGDTQLGGG